MGPHPHVRSYCENVPVESEASTLLDLQPKLLMRFQIQENLDVLRVSALLVDVSTQKTYDWGKSF